MKDCYCAEIDNRPCPVCGLARPWVELTNDEKSKTMAYVNILKANKRPSPLMVNYITHLHNKYPDFSLASVSLNRS